MLAMSLRTRLTRLERLPGHCPRCGAAVDSHGRALALQGIEGARERLRERLEALVRRRAELPPP